MNRRVRVILLFILAAASICASIEPSSAQNRRRKASSPPVEPREMNRYRVVGGVRHEVGAHALPDSVLRDTVAMRHIFELMIKQGDSLSRAAARNLHDADSIVTADPNLAPYSDSLRRISSSQKHIADSLAIEKGRLLVLMPELAMVRDSLMAQADTTQVLSRRELRRQEKFASRGEDFVRYSPFFRDTLPISRMTALSFIAPGFGQLHNKQYWKIPVLYAAVGTTAFMGFQEHKCYRRARTVYDELIFYGYTRADSDLDQVQRVMIQHNQRRQLWFGLAAATYIYFICDGVMNHPSPNKEVKIATTLSTIIPGAGQIYNKSYWKVPIVMGVFATTTMMIDWNNRGYQRFKLAYDLKTTGGVVEQQLQRYSAAELANFRKSYRRNRDLCIILTGAVYLINIIDAHVDAHMKDYDVSEDSNLSLRPMLSLISTTKGGSGNALGFSMNLKF